MRLTVISRLLTSVREHQKMRLPDIALSRRLPSEHNKTSYLRKLSTHGKLIIRGHNIRGSKGNYLHSICVEDICKYSYCRVDDIYDI